MPKNLKGSASTFMRSKKELCQSWKLYVITQPMPGLADRVRQAILGGADVIQLRDKNAADEDLIRQSKSLLEVTRHFHVPLIINDRVAVAQMVGADGVHLGQDDGALSAARTILGEEAIFGRSTHKPEQALAAEKEGFDYIGVGPVFETPTKAGRPAVGLEYVRFAAQNVRIPFIAIGGIDAANLEKVTHAGAGAVAVVRAVIASADPQEAATVLKKNISGKKK